jgi:hypothetical protein
MQRSCGSGWRMSMPSSGVNYQYHAVFHNMLVARCLCHEGSHHWRPIFALFLRLGGLILARDASHVGHLVALDSTVRSESRKAAASRASSTWYGREIHRLMLLAMLLAMLQCADTPPRGVFVQPLRRPRCFEHWLLSACPQTDSVFLQTWPFSLHAIQI